MNKTGSRARARITQMNIHANEWARARRIFFYECSRQLEARDTCSRCARVRPIRGARNRIIGEQIPPTTSATEHPKSLRFQSLVPLVYPDNDSSLGLSRFVAFWRCEFANTWREESRRWRDIFDTTRHNELSARLWLSFDLLLVNIINTVNWSSWTQ